MNKIKSIKTELAACRKAFRESPKAKWAWCIHHAIPVEIIWEDIEERIKHILQYKPKRQQALRLRNMRPVRVWLPRYLIRSWRVWEAAVKVSEKADKNDCKAWKLYQASRVKRGELDPITDELRAAYDRASGISAEATNEAELARDSFDTMRRSCPGLLQVRHTRDWPDHTWNSVTSSIFEIGGNY